jgi:hypothetical protein
MVMWVAHRTTVCRQRRTLKKRAVGSIPTALEELPFVDSFRTLCLAPTPEMKAVFDDLQQLALAG